MNDETGNVEWLVVTLGKALRHAEAVSDDIDVQDGLRLTGTVMRLDRVRDALEDAWHTLRLVYDDAEARDRILSADGTVGVTPSGSTRVVADILCAAATGFRERRGTVDAGGYRTEDVVA